MLRTAVATFGNYALAMQKYEISGICYRFSLSFFGLYQKRFQFCRRVAPKCLFCCSRCMDLCLYRRGFYVIWPIWKTIGG